MIDHRNRDAHCIRRSLSGDTEAFRGLVERYERRAYWVARKFLDNEEDARDTVQEAFMRAHRSLPSFDPKRRFFTWLYRIVVNVAIDHLRWRDKRVTVSLRTAGEPPAEETPCSLQRAEVRSRVTQVLNSLPPKYRAIIVLRDIEGLNAKTAASILGILHGTARWRHHRARQLFRASWEEAFGSPLHTSPDLLVGV